MTDTPTNDAPARDAATTEKPARRSGGALGGKVLAELQEIASGLGIAGAKKMRKGELIDAIKQARGESTPTAVQAAPAADAPVQDQLPQDPPAQDAPARRRTRQDAATDGAVKNDAPKNDAPKNGGAKNEAPKNDGAKNDGAKNEGAKKNDNGRKNDGGQRAEGKQNDGKQNDGAKQNEGGNRRRNDADQNQGGGNQGGSNQAGSNQAGAKQQADDDEDGGGRRRNRRGRNRGNRGPDGEPTYTEDDVLVPAAGILDILDNYAFVRTTGYLPSENDVYVSLSMVRKWGLRKGDAVTGQVRQPREGERKEKFNPMVRVDTVNGTPLEDARGRVELAQLTPVFPDERLHLETTPDVLTTRVLDVFAPLGKGQRGLVVTPPQAGSTQVLQAVAEAISTNNPECHLMVVLVDERPEEVTEMRRAVKGEVIASTFDRPAADHTTVAELAIERAERLVELGHDVVVLLDSLTRLGRAYNQAAPAAGRVGPGGVDVAALHPAKRIFGAARNVEDGGSLTILATAHVETGSRADEVILEEIQGAENMVVRLSRRLADQRIFPSVDVRASGTRREELLVDAQELGIVATIRRALGDLDEKQALETVLERLRPTASNAEFLLKAGTSFRA